MAGTLGRLDMVEPADLQAGSASLLGASEQAKAWVQGKGIPVPTTPDWRGEMPYDLTSLDDRQLGDLLNKLSRWCGYLDFEVSQANGTRTAAEANLEFVKARIRIGLKADDDGRKMTVKDKDDVISTDPRVIEAWSRWIFFETTYQYLKTMRDDAQKNWDTVSRRITQRGQEVERMRRETSVAGVIVPPSSPSFRPQY